MTLACTLTAAELRARRAYVAAIAEGSLRSRRSVPGGERLRFDPAAEPALRELVGLERECCPFLRFEVRVAGEDLERTVTRRMTRPP